MGQETNRCGYGNYQGVGVAGVASTLYSNIIFLLR